MKLTDLKLTPAGLAATKKLARQVQKGSVAAAMEPKLKLGVVGIEIGQQQSTGATSLTEAQVPVEDAIRLLRKLAKELQYDGLTSSDDPVLWATALTIGRLYDEGDSTLANLAVELLDKMEGRISRLATTTVPPGDYIDWLHNLKKLGMPSNPLMDFFQKLEDAQLSAKEINPSVQKFSEGIRDILNFFDFITAAFVPDGHGFDPLQVKMIKQVCTKLGFKT